jgi:Ca-activated chloride channel family protein
VGQVDPLTAGELAAGYGIRVYTIAIGREGRVKLPIRQKGLFGKTITTYQWFDNQLNTDLLQKISAMTHGKSYRVTEESALGDVFREIDALEKTQIKSTEHVRYDEIYQKPLKGGLAMLLVEQLLARGWWRMIP